MKNVAIVGGGLAGLTAALELVQRGFHVTVYEGRDDLGGKAASITSNDVFDGQLKPVTTGIATEVRSDHGYHVFPLWYLNMRRLWQRIGLPASDVFESGEYYALQRGNAYDFRSPKEKGDRERFSLLDLVTRTDDEVDALSFRGFLSSRIYNDLDSVSLNELFLNALSIPEYDISSRVVRNLFRQWMPVIEEKNWAALKGSLGEVLIDRLVAAIYEAEKAAGGSFTLKQGLWLKEIQLSKKGKPRLLLYRKRKDGDKQGAFEKKPSEVVKGQPVVMAIPLDVLRGLVSDELFHAEPALRNLHYLRAHQFGALDVYFKRKLPNIPKDHFDLAGSIYNLSSIDISELWPDFKKRGYPGSVLQFVAGSCRSLSGLSAQAFTRALLDEIAQFIPDATAEGIAYLVPHANSSQPLFVNDVNTWDYRPSTEGRLFYFAGDYVQNETDITSMEGAVRSGLDAAEAVRRTYAPSSEAVQIIAPMGSTDEEIKRKRDEIVLPGRAKLFLRYKLRDLLDEF